MIHHTQKWIWEVVIGLGFCPFAKREMQRDTVRFVITDSADPEAGLLYFRQECKFLDDHPETATTLLIFPNASEDFMEFLGLVDAAEDWIAAAGLEGIYQVASFHPNYLFADAPADDPANYTNRSPYAMLHILREEQLERALEFYPDDPDEIPERNIRVAREKGLEAIRRLRDSCFHIP